MDKTDSLEAYIIADFASVGRISCEPWRGWQFLTLQRLSKHRHHLIECIAREKAYMVSNIYLKFSELSVLDKEEHPFANLYGATTAAVLIDFLSLDDIVYVPIDDLVSFVSEKGKNRFCNSLETAQLLQKAARDSYCLDKVLYKPLNTSIASFFNVIKAFTVEIKTLDKAIEKTIKGINTTEYL